MRSENRDVTANAKAMRWEMRKGEAAVWAVLKGNKTGFRFRRQVQVNRYILDFGCNAYRLGIEIDGHPYHLGERKMAADDRRTGSLNRVGWSILRVSDTSVRHNANWFSGHVVAVMAHLIHGSPLPDGNKEWYWFDSAQQ